MGSITPSSGAINISKETVTHLEPAPLPEPGILLGVRTGKVGRLAHKKSAIFKIPREGPVFVTETGLIEDEHDYIEHGGIDRAVHQYCIYNYDDWRQEGPPKPHLFDLGAFGENLNATNMTEHNVCVGDLYRIGADVIVEVSEPRHPCYKLDIRFEWSRGLKRIQRTGRTGWNYRVLQTGYIKKGDTIALIKRPHPRWSCMNVQKVIRAKSVPLELLEECSDLKVLTDKFRGLARRRLEGSPKIYSLIEATPVTPRVKQLTFELKNELRLDNSAFQPHAFAQIRFGPDLSIERSYSIVSGDLHRFTLGVALDDASRGGSAYLHKNMHIGDEVEMLPGSNPTAVEHDKVCEEAGIDNRIVIIGGIGVTAFLPLIKQWEQQNLPFEIHYAIRSPAEAAFANLLPPVKTRTYAKSESVRLNFNTLIPDPTLDGQHRTRIFCCGPTRLMTAVQTRASELNYPPHLLHFEDFGATPTDNLGDPFEVEVDEPDTRRKETLNVPSDKTLLEVLNEAGFDVMSSCRTGGCGACKVTLCGGKVDYRSRILTEEQKAVALQSCVDRGVGKIKVEID